MKVLKYLLPMLLLAIVANAQEGSEGTGGGSSVAAEITRATNSFIEMVKQNPDLFVGVDPVKLRNMRAQVLVTSQPILVCQNQAELEAWSDINSNYSKFSLPAWLTKGELAKIQLAGHERLVLAGYEASNTYDISNKVYEVNIRNLERQYGSTSDICDFGERACLYKKNIENHIASILNGYVAGNITPDGAEELLGGVSTLMHMQINGLVSRAVTDHGFKWSEKRYDSYKVRLGIAFQKHFDPLFKEANKIISENTQKEKCVYLSR